MEFLLGVYCIWNFYIKLIKEIFKGKVGGLSKQVAKNMDLMAEEERFDSCSIRKVKSYTVLYNVPFSHYAEFTGISTNIGIITKSGMLNNNVCGNVHVCVYNSSTESCILPAGMLLGLLYLKRYYDPSEELL